MGHRAAGKTLLFFRLIGIAHTGPRVLWMDFDVAAFLVPWPILFLIVSQEYRARYLTLEYSIQDGRMR